jgi:hypothetical protein
MSKHGQPVPGTELGHDRASSGLSVIVRRPCRSSSRWRVRRGPDLVLSPPLHNSRLPQPVAATPTNDAIGGPDAEPSRGALLDGQLVRRARTSSCMERRVRKGNAQRTRKEQTVVVKVESTIQTVEEHTGWCRFGGSRTQPCRGRSPNSHRRYEFPGGTGSDRVAGAQSAHGTLASAIPRLPPPSGNRSPPGTIHCLLRKAGKRLRHLSLRLIAPAAGVGQCSNMRPLRLSSVAVSSVCPATSCVRQSARREA